MSARPGYTLPATTALSIATLALASLVPSASPAVAQERPMVTVPSVIGTPLTRAVEALARAGIRVVRVDSVSADAETGTVVRQAPAPQARVPVPSAGSLWVAVATVSRTPPQRPPVVLTVPDVVGSLLDPARAVLEEVGVGVARVHPVDSEAERGTVLRQLPQPGTEIQRGMTAELWVSTGAARPPPLPQVPDVIGLTVDSARRVLLEVKVPVESVRFQPSDSPEGIVLDQRPGAGDRVEPGTPGALLVSSGPPQPSQVVVPRLVDLTLEDAFRHLRDATLQGEVLGYAESPLGQGRVADQRPQPGSVVAPGTAVGVVISTGPAVSPPDSADPGPPSPDSAADETTPGGGGDDVTPPDPTPLPPVEEEPVTPAGPRPVAVPDLFGLTETEAGRVAGVLGFGLSASRVANENVEPGTVFAQQPEPGTLVEPGSEITVDVAPTEAATIPGWILPAAVVLVGLVGFIRTRRRRHGGGDEVALAGDAPPPPPPAPRPVPSSTALAFRPRPGRPRTEIDVDGPLVTDLVVALEPKAVPPPTAAVTAEHGFTLSGDTP